jgi:hypothetical protein
MASFQLLLDEQCVARTSPLSMPTGGEAEVSLHAIRACMHGLYCAAARDLSPGAFWPASQVKEPKFYVRLVGPAIVVGGIERRSRTEFAVEVRAHR